MGNSLKKAEQLFFIANTINKNPGLTASQLAEKCNATERSVYRYIKSLESCGLQITSMGKGGYHLMESPIQKQARLTQEEYVALLLSLSFIDKKAMGGALKTALEKVQVNVMESKSLPDLASLLGNRIRMQSEKMTENEAENMQKILQAMIENCSLDCQYYTMSREEETFRLIDPYYLAPYEGHLYLIGYCHLRKQLRHFRLNRFQCIERKENKFLVDSNLNVDDYMKNIWGMQNEGVAIQFKVRFSKEVARYIKEKDWGNVHHRLISQEDGDVILELTTNSPTPFLRWLKQYGKEAELLEPIEYRQIMLDELQSLIEMYRN